MHNTHPLVVDTFPFNDELDMLQMRLEEMDPAVDFFVAVEADVDHLGNPKPYHLSDNVNRFSAWADKLVVVRATGLPTAIDNPDPWSREEGQRDFVGAGLDDISSKVNLDDSTVVLHGDVDEICRPQAVGHAAAVNGPVTFQQRLHCFAVDWLHPSPWAGTVAVKLGRLADLGPHPFRRMRDSRTVNTALPDAGWHMSWLGGRERTKKKLGSTPHTEIVESTTPGIESDLYLREGIHVDGVCMTPVDVDGTWPAFVFERRCPSEWFRPR